MTIEYASDIVKCPDHLNEDFFHEALENAIRNSHAKIKRIEVGMGSKVGENYLSQIYRVKIHYEELNEKKTAAVSRKFSLILKSMPESQPTEFMLDLQVYLKEKTIYVQLLPRMETLLEQGRFGPRIYHSIKAPIRTLVFEDMADSDYRMASRQQGLDEAHARVLLNKLANFHAISMVLAKKDPQLMAGLNDGVLAECALDSKDSMLMPFFGNHVKAVIDLADKWPGYESIVKKLRVYAANIRDSLLAAQQPIPGELQVLNHGDLWVNNILFQYDEATNQPKDVAFLDFQMSIWSSPGIDLNYFFYTSLQYDLMKNKVPELLRCYYDEFAASLRRLHYDPVPSFDTVQKEFKRRAPYGFFANYGVYPIITMEEENCRDNDIDNFSDEDFALKKVAQTFSSKQLQQTLKYTLKHFDQMGIWD